MFSSLNSTLNFFFIFITTESIWLSSALDQSPIIYYITHCGHQSCIIIIVNDRKFSFLLHCARHLLGSNFSPSRNGKPGTFYSLTNCARSPQQQQPEDLKCTTSIDTNSSPPEQHHLRSSTINRSDHRRSYVKKKRVEKNRLLR